MLVEHDTSNRLSALKVALDKAKKNTCVMLSKIELYEKRLSRIDDSMLPIQNRTAVYSKAKENIGLTLAEVEKTYEFFRIATSVDSVITGGLNMQNPTKQREFFEAIGRLCEAKKFFLNHKREIKSSESALESIQLLLSQAVGMCQEELERLLLSCGSSVAKDETGEYSVVNAQVPVNSKDIKAICELFETNGIDCHYEVYEKVRLTQVISTVTAHNTEHARDWALLMQQFQETPYQRGNNQHPFRLLCNLCLELLKGELKLWGSTLPSSAESLRIFINICYKIVELLENSVTNLMTLDESLPTSNNGKRLTEHDVVREQSNKVLARLEIVELFMLKYEDFRDICKPDFRNESDASRFLSGMRDVFVQSTVKGIETLIQTSNNSYVVSLSGVSSSSSTTINTPRGEKDKELTCDIDITTGIVLHFCKELLSFNPAAYVNFYRLAVEQRLKMSSTATSTQQICSLMLDNLLKSLDMKSHRLEPSSKCKAQRNLQIASHSLYESGEGEGDDSLLWARKHLFLINNLYAVELYLLDRKKEVGGSGGIGIVGGSKTDAAVGPVRGLTRVASTMFGNVNVADNARYLIDLCDNVERRLTEERLEFCEAVACALSMSPSDMVDFQGQYHRGDKTGKQRVLKAKFSLFNSGLDALESLKGEWRISSAILREQVANQLTDSILQKYKEFYDTYSIIPFSKKHMKQYLRFPPEDVDRILRYFFGKTA